MEWILLFCFTVRLVMKLSNDLEELTVGGLLGSIFPEFNSKACQVFFNSLVHSGWRFGGHGTSGGRVGTSHSPTGLSISVWWVISVPARHNYAAMQNETGHPKGLKASQRKTRNVSHALVEQCTHQLPSLQKLGSFRVKMRGPWN